MLPSVQPLAPTATGGSFRASTPQSATRSAAPPIPAVRSGLASPASQHRQADLFADESTDEPEVLASPTVEQRNEVNNLQTQVAATQRSVSTLRDQRTKQSKEAEDIEKEIGELKLALSQAKAAYDVESTNMTNLEVRHKTGNDELKKLKEQTITAESDLSALREQKIELEQSILKDKEEMREINRKLKATNEEVEALRQDHERLKKDIRQQKGLLVVHRKQLSTAEGQRETTQSDIAQSTKELNDTKAEVAAAGEQAAASVAPAAALLHEQARHVALPHSEAVSPAPSVTSIRSTNPFERKGAFSPALMAAGGAGVGLAAAAAVVERAKSPLAGDAVEHHSSLGEVGDVPSSQDIDQDPFGAQDGLQMSENTHQLPEATQIAAEGGFDDDFNSAFGPPATAMTPQPARAAPTTDFDDAFAEFDTVKPASDHATQASSVQAPSMFVPAAPVTRDFAAEAPSHNAAETAGTAALGTMPTASSSVNPPAQAFGSTADQPYESRADGESDDDDADDLPPIRDIEPQEDSDSDVESEDDSQRRASAMRADMHSSAIGHPHEHDSTAQSLATTTQADTSLPGAYPSAGSDTEDAFVDAPHTQSVHTMSPRLHEQRVEPTAGHGEQRPNTVAADAEQPSQQAGSSFAQVAHTDDAPATTSKAIDDFDDFEDLAPARVESVPDATPSTSAPTSAIPVTAASAGFDDAFDDDFGFDKQTFSQQTGAPPTSAAPSQLSATNAAAKPSFDADFDDAFGMPQAAPPLPKRPAVGFDDDFFSSPLPSNPIKQPATTSSVSPTLTAPVSQDMSYMAPPPGSPPRQPQSASQPPAMPPRQPSTKPLSRDEALQELISMGFSQRQAQSALEDNQYDVSRAANALLAVNM